MENSEENSQTHILEGFKEVAAVNEIIGLLVDHCSDDIMLEADLEKLTCKYYV